MFTGIFGHKKQIEFLEKSIQSGKVSHAYIFAGPEFVGKKLVAQKFAKELLEWNDSKDFHPDFLELGNEEAIKIEQIRELIYKLSLRPYQAKYKVALIDNADSMTDEAQNALLKVLEEPKSYTVIILVTVNPQILLRTISSRAQKISFGHVLPAEYESLIPEKLEKETKNLILTLADGKPGLAKSISSNEEVVEKLLQTSADFDVVSSSDLGGKLKLAYDLANLETADLRSTLGFWLIRYEQRLKSDASIKNARNAAVVSQARKYLDANVNSKLLLTNLMLNLT